MTIRAMLWMVPALVAGWIGVMAVVMLVSDAAPAAVVIWPDDGFVTRLPEDAAILSATALTLTVSSDVPGFGAAMYRAGALLVLPAGLPGCLPLPEPAPEP